MKHVIILIGCFLIAISVLAQDLGYELTTTPPNNNMIALHTSIVYSRYPDGSAVYGEITGYIIWHIDNREPDYYITLTDGRVAILNRATIESYNPEFKTATVQACSNDNPAMGIQLIGDLFIYTELSTCQR